jgi:hypothetical protein
MQVSCGTSESPGRTTRARTSRSTSRLMLKQGTHLKAVSERLGRAGIAITADLYSHVLPGLQASAAAQLERLFAEPAAAAHWRSISSC